MRFMFCSVQVKCGGCLRRADAACPAVRDTGMRIEAYIESSYSWNQVVVGYVLLFSESVIVWENAN